MSDDKKPDAATSASPAAEERPSDPAALYSAANKAFARKEYAPAADQYGELLEALRDEHGEDAPLLAPIFHRYGRALLEHAMANSSALGGPGGASTPAPKKKAKSADKGEGSSSAAAAADARFSFGGDAPSDDEDDDEDEQAGEGGDDDEEDEDELSIAFAVLELARVRYEKILGIDSGKAEDAEGEPVAKDETKDDVKDAAAKDVDVSLDTLDDTKLSSLQIKAELAEVYNDLGDLGLESENFSQATADYDASLRLLIPLLQPHSRRLADAYLRLGLALEFHPETSKRSDANRYVEGARAVLQRRAEALAARLRILKKLPELADAAAAAAEAAARAAEPDVKRLETDDVAEMEEAKAEKEKKDVDEMLAELQLKLDEYKAAAAAPSAEASGSGSGSTSASAAEAALQKAINEALVGGSTNSIATSKPTGPVHDLTSMVKKKKPVSAAPAAKEEEQTSGKGKRKAEETNGEDEGAKKAKAE